MNRSVVVALIIIILLVLIVVVALVKEKERRVIECPITNSTYSFCFIKDGRAYYFDIIGWISPNTTILEKYIESKGTFWGGAYTSYGKGIVLFLALRTNLEWKWHMSCAEAHVSEIYKVCLLGSISKAIRVNNNMFLIPFVLEENDFWESYKIVSESYVRTNNVRLYFKPWNFLNLKSEQKTVVKIGKIAITPNEYDEDSLCIYVDYPPPQFSLSIKSIRYLGSGSGWHVLNASFQVNNCGFVVYYSFDEFGQKEMLSEEFLPLYFVTIEESPSRKNWIMSGINETHYLVAIPTASGHLFSIRYHFGSCFRDVWLEPRHEYEGSYVSPGDEFWLKIEVNEDYAVGDTFIFVTPWGETYKCEKLKEDAM